MLADLLWIGAERSVDGVVDVDFVVLGSRYLYFLALGFSLFDCLLLEIVKTGFTAEVTDLVEVIVGLEANEVGVLVCVSVQASGGRRDLQSVAPSTHLDSLLRLLSAMAFKSVSSHKKQLLCRLTECFLRCYEAFNSRLLEMIEELVLERAALLPGEAAPENALATRSRGHSLPP